MAEPAASPPLAPEAPVPQAGTRTAMCYIVDEEPSVRHFLSLILHGMGVETEEFASGSAFRRSIAQSLPDLVWLDVSLEATDAIESIAALAKQSYQGPIQLISNRGSAVLENIRNIGEQHSLAMLPVLKKPFDNGAVQRIIHELKMGTPVPAAARIGLDEALKNDWIEFWYQPKIDLRKKQLSGAEAYARARHPQFGVLAPTTFLPGAEEASLTALAERAVASMLKGSSAFSSFGVRLRLSINMPIKTLENLRIAEIVNEHRPGTDWPGLLIDIPEEQAVTHIELARDLARRLEPHNVRLAIDEFGRSHSSLMKMKDLPFAEMKLDRAFVTDCGTDKINAPICKTVIDLAHKSGARAVAMGIEKSADILALATMGCDEAQGALFGQPMSQQSFLSLLKQRAGIARDNARSAVAQPA